MVGKWWKTMENSMEVPQQIRDRLPRDPAIHSWVYIQKNEKQDLEEISVLSCSFQNHS